MSLPDCPRLLHPIWKVSWKHGCPCRTLCVCHNQPISGHTALLECVYASVHVFMSIWLPISVWCPVDSYMERCVPLCSTVCVFQSLYFWLHTLVRMYTHVSTSIYVHLTLHVYSIPTDYLHENVGTPLWHCEFVKITMSGPSPWLECVHVTVQVFMSIWLPISFWPPYA